MRNRFAGNCRDCGQRVAESAGYFHKEPKGSRQKWSVRCIRCVAEGKRVRGAPLSHAQTDALRQAAAPSSEEPTSRVRRAEPELSTLPGISS